jgi:hypothetical protein
MATKSNTKSNNQKRGGSRPGAGRPRGRPGVGEGADRAELLRNAAIEVALGGLDRALKAYETDAESLFTPLQSRWHLAMVLFGVPPDTIGEALLKPGTSGRFRATILAAIDAVSAEALR